MISDHPTLENELLVIVQSVDTSRYNTSESDYYVFRKILGLVRIVPYHHMD